MNRIRTVSIAFFLLLAAGCAAKQQPTFADNMRVVASQWDKGKNLIKSGEEQIRKGEQQQREAEELMAKGKSNVEKGEEKIKDGKFLVEMIEREHPEVLQEPR
jgi:uncharacterized protein YcfL